MNRAFIFKGLAFLMIVLLLVVLGHIIEQMGKFQAEGKHETDIIVEVPAGASLTRIAHILVEAGAISEAPPFVTVIRLSGSAGEIHAGEFRIPARASMADIFSIFQKGEVVTYSLTIPEGLSSLSIVEILNNNSVLTGPIGATPAEGSLLPETYQYRRGDTRQMIVSRMIKAMRDYVQHALMEMSPEASQLTPEELIVLASIVEKETALDDERSMIAGVFYNRLKRHMRLQSDPTVIYGITLGAPFGRAIRQSDLDRVTPYNTYRVDGLPPTPIANPGKASIEAVLWPAETDALYFVADGTGGHVFAETLSEHNENVARWRRLQR